MIDIKYVVKATQTDWHNEESYLCDMNGTRWTSDPKAAHKFYLSDAQNILAQLKCSQKVAHSAMPWGCGKLKAVSFELVRADDAC